ncbi:hypothetical protein DH2020_035093 [Rehmannia glutinosa]|uniref:Uncharacterized protein n=1 Tax=Rehmannia glutinosa TaxID=99300 RepID=A0ABR0VAD7_REHGL
MSAIQAIQMISNWLYWQSPHTYSTPPATQNSQPGTRRQAGPNIKRLKAAAEARKQATTTSRPKESSISTHLSTGRATTPDSPSKATLDTIRKTNRPRSNAEFLVPKKDSGNPFRWGVPIGTAVVAAVVVRLQLGETTGGLKDHIGGSMVLDIVNSSWLQVGLAGVTWYLIGMYVVALVEAVVRRK